ncbi:phytoene desaturase family protein [Mycobacteroides franklinii]|uniref:phytoene desaturase family protein n=1 Tax=Mycobacteroides franklinii TaxID=948102 RepID=UPI0009931FEF|nr:NAD(P)/FAD-dependent oxidoreductase [Mycobacteroides franklinii]
MGVTQSDRFDTVIVGGGHNALTAAAYLARAGQRVLLLERLDMLGGAAISAPAFEGFDARLSRYSYLVSLMPRQIIDDLGLDIRLARRKYASYTPDPADGGRSGFLASTHDFAEFGALCDSVTRPMWDSMLKPLQRRSDVRAGAWEQLVEAPIGEVIRGATPDDLQRGVLLTDALIGTFASADDPSLQQNICFLYHHMNPWDVPIGGMGAVTGSLEASARRHGAELRTGAEVLSISPDGEVRYGTGGEEHTVAGDRVLSGVSPTVLANLVGETPPAGQPGAQVKVNLLLKRLPRLRDENVTPEQAFGGTFHINETYTQLENAYRQASSGQIPDPLPCEIYCHSLADPSILSPQLRAAGAQTLTVFGLHTPHGLDATGEQLQDAVLASLNSVLAEPITDVVAADGHGRPCIETKTTIDLENALGMTAGNIFHGGLQWPFAEDDEPLETAAQRWGVATAHDRILLCGSGSRRGGGVSGLGGLHAAMAVLEAR